MSLADFHPAVSAWFTRRFTAPTEPQSRAWPSIRAGRHTLVAAPTGSGKTLAAFLAAIDSLVRQAQDGPLPDATQVVYVSPLKALGNDIQRNLQEPLAGVRAELESRGLVAPEIRVFLRTGDTPAAQRAAMVKRPPHLVVTTPESLYILLTSERGRNMLRTTHTVIVDEIHALVGNKRGSHLALSLERLDALAGRRLIRVGLSATQRPIDDVARFLVGTGEEPDGMPECTIVDVGHARALDLAIEVPASPLEAVMAGEVWEETYDRLAALVASHRTTLVFVNTRRMAERVARHLSTRLGTEHVTSHHGSLSREHRLQAEERLKHGQLRALVATASLELGIDIGDVDLVCQLGSTRSIATLLQRVGRAGHGLGRLPKGRLFPLSRDELVECAALLDAVRRRELDRLSIPSQPLDILAQQIVAAVACEEWREDDLFALVRRAFPYRHLQRGDFDAIVEMLAHGFSTRRGRRSAHVHHDGVNERLRARRGARLTAITNGGAIPDTADYQVLLEPTGVMVGSVNEDFAIESMPGDIFQLGNASWRIRRVEPGRVRVEDAHGQPPSLPFWLGEAPGRTAELSAAVSRLRLDVAARIDSAEMMAPAAASSVPGADAAAAPVSFAGCRWLVDEVGVTPQAARQIVDYLAAGAAALGVMPSQETIVLERFFDETGGMQLVVHSPFGSRLNRAWGLALRKRFCRKFNIELQAAATEDAIVISLGPTHSFPLAEVAQYLHAKTVRDVLVQALLAAPMFAVRWRWNCTRSLAVPRNRGGRKLAPQLQRILAEDLLAVVFPDQLACAENVPGDREIPDHPLVQQTVHDCLEEAMDIRALESLLERVASGAIAIVARDRTEPSPLAQEILNARPYAFLDDAPLEERRTQAVASRRWLDPQSAADLGALDAEAITRVRAEIWPQPENADEMHEALVLFGFLSVAETGRATHADFVPSDIAIQETPLASRWDEFLVPLVSTRRAATLRPEGGHELWIAAERLPQFAALFPGVRSDPPLVPPPRTAARSDEAMTPETALVEILRSRLEGAGPITAAALAQPLGIPLSAAEIALLTLETEGFVLRGRFTPGVEEQEWCERRLLARIHRYTLDRLRREIEPVSAADFIRFLFEWQRLAPQHDVEGPEGLAAVVAQLEGFEAPANAWENEILPARVADYDPVWLDSLCLSGRCVWSRLSAGRSAWRSEGVSEAASSVNAPPDPVRRGRAGPVRTTPMALLERRNLASWPQLEVWPEEMRLTAAAQRVVTHLETRGASFFDDIVLSTRLLRTQVESALGELVAHGVVTADSFMGLRALLVPSSRRKPLREGGRRRHAGAHFGVEDAGRWGLVRRRDAAIDAAHPVGPPDAAHSIGTPASNADAVARVLLRRWGVVFRKLVERETAAPVWGDLLRALRRMEARGEIRGGRFVDGFAGEQFALPEAVGTLRQVRRSPREGILVAISGADPLNLVGVLTPGPRVPSHADNRVLFRDGVPIAVRMAREVRLLEPPAAGAGEWDLRQALSRRRPSAVRRGALRFA
ncbi:MAG TPA: DEAD/DEAH box helicase [Candidatus Krumholzibacteria bacterium]|nr:DEAD/DEAH box helicase [Candidatus Krumholzibacteria bacterium]